MARYPNVQYVHFYTDGNAARRLEPVTPFKKNTAHLPVPQKHKRKAIYVDPVAMLGIFVALCTSVMMAVGIGQLAQAKAEKETMTAYVQYLEQEKQVLTQEYVQSYELDDVRRTALALGMVPKEQIESTQILITEP